MFISGAIAATTIQMADFKDEDGDRSVGRRTLPLLLPTTSRVGTFVLLAWWSLYLTQAWRLSALVSMWLVGLAVYTGARIVLLRGKAEDKKSYWLYSVSDV